MGLLQQHEVRKARADLRRADDPKLAERLLYNIVGAAGTVFVFSAAVCVGILLVGKDALGAWREHKKEENNER